MRKNQEILPEVEGLRGQRLSYRENKASII